LTRAVHTTACRAVPQHLPAAGWNGGTLRPVGFLMFASLQSRTTTTAEPAAAQHYSIWLQRACSCGGKCEHCQQSQLPINEPGDEYEREAEQAALAVTGSRTSGSAPLSLQRVPAPSGRAGSIAPPIVHQVLNSPGRHLDRTVRVGMESRFGHSFEKVRVHTDALAAESAHAVAARAYTVGSNIVFGPGRYAPGSEEGRRLLAHELAHVVQQSGSGQWMQRDSESDKKKPWIRIPIFDQLDPCATLPVFGGSTLCTSDVKKGIDILKGGKKDKPQGGCGSFPNMEPGRGEFDGLCCTKQPVQMAANCCSSDRVNPGTQACCPEGTNPEGNECKKGTLPTFEICPPEQLAAVDGCCRPPLVRDSIGLHCVRPGAAPLPPPPAPAPPVAKAIGGVKITFFRDMPQDGNAFSASATSDGQSKFKTLVASLAAQPGASVQLAANASSEKPKTDATYNSRLTDRRVEMVAAELTKSKIDASRISDPPGVAAPTGCTAITAGELSCGDSAAKTTVDPGDRNVTALVFTVGP
jgi:Domain of unknown function (DUF4157)